MVLVASILCLVPAIAFAWKVIRSDWAYFRAEKSTAIFLDARSKNSDDPRLAGYIAQADDAIQQALALWPQNPDYLSLAAQISTQKAFNLAADQSGADIRKQSVTQALEYLRQAIRLNPVNAQHWALLAEYKIRAGQRDQEWLQAREKALELGGADPKMVERMLSL